MCSTALAPECAFGRLRSMVLPPSCVRLLSRNFSKMHCFRIAEAVVPEPGEAVGGLGDTRVQVGRALSDRSMSNMQVTGTMEQMELLPGSWAERPLWLQSQVNAQ